jgi:hypothetical protein
VRARRRAALILGPDRAATVAEVDGLACAAEALLAGRA